MGAMIKLDIRPERHYTFWTMKRTDSRTRARLADPSTLQTPAEVMAEMATIATILRETATELRNGMNRKHAANRLDICADRLAKETK